MVMPGLSRAIAPVMKYVPRAAASGNGAARSWPAPRRPRRSGPIVPDGGSPGGSTPTTVYQSLSMRSLRPIASGDAAKRRRHSASLMTSTSVMPGPSSSGPKQPSELRPHAEHVEVRRTGQQHLDALGFVDFGQVGVDRPHAGDGRRRDRCDRGSRAARAATCRRRWRSSAVKSAVTRTSRSAMRVRQRPHDHRVDDGEDGAVGADAERQRGNGDRGEARAIARVRATRIASPAEGCPSWCGRNRKAQATRPHADLRITAVFPAVAHRARCSASGTRVCESGQRQISMRDVLGTFPR